MSEICRYLEWDSDYFGFRIGQVLGETLDKDRVGPIIEWCSSNAIDCLYFLAAADNYVTTRTAEQNGFELMDYRVAFRLPLDSARMSERRNVIRPATPDDIEPANDIARRIHKGGRFHFDPRLAHKADEFYGVWITNSVRGFADAVFVCEVDSSVAGYVTCKINQDGSGQIGLIGVATERQGLGIGRDLVNAAAEWFGDHGCPEVRVVTQGRNIPAHILYQKCGFVTASVNYWYHRWRQDA